ncbi:MAG: LPS assembly protein LptD [Terriglobales bacterium]
MTTRFRIFITAAVVCHLLLTHGIVTSQTLPPGATTAPSASAAAPALPTAPVSDTEEPVTIRAVQQEKEGSIYHLRGAAEVDYRNYILQADQITYNTDTGDAELEGHVVLDGGPYDEHVVSSHGTYNVRTQVGTFYSVVGTVGLRMRTSRYAMTTTNPFAFTGKVVEKHGPDHYLVREGTVTTCELPHPDWQFSARRMWIDVDSTAKIYNSDFRVLGIPVFYFPFVMLPVQKEERKTGLLIPSFGNSSTKGLIAGDSIYWVFNRSMDATLGAEYYSKRGWFEREEFRARPSDTSYIYFNYQGMVDRGIGTPAQNQGGEDARFIAERNFGSFRGVANVDYLSSFVFRIAFTDVYTQAIDSEVKSQIFLTNTTNGFHFDALAERYQNFEVCNPQADLSAGCAVLSQTELVRILHTPSVFLSGEERQLGNTPLYWSFQSAAEGLQRREIPEGSQLPLGLRTADLVGRFDLAPSLSMPMQWQGWSFRPALTLRDTFYTEEFNAAYALATGHAANDILNRKSLEASVELRPPALSRVFDHPWLGRKWKHVIEPRMKYDYVTGVNNIGGILRFDATDILTNTNEIEYSLVNRIYSKRLDPNAKDCDVPAMSTLNIGGVPQVGAVPWEAPQQDTPTCTSGPREVLSWEIGQKYFFDPTFGNALVVGQRNVFATTADFTGIAFLDSERRFAPIISRLRIETSPRTSTEWDLDYDLDAGRINASTALVNYHYGQFTVGGGDAFLRVIDTAAGTTPTSAFEFHQFRVLFGYGQLNKRGLSAASSFGFDANLGSLQYATAQTSYNWDCCGLSLEYRRFALGSVRNENQYRFSFTLANIGAFGNLRRQERLY